MSRRNSMFFFIITLVISIIILIITLTKDITSPIGYGLFGLFIFSSTIFLSLFIRNDSIRKYRKIELEAFIKNHPELEIVNFEINNTNCYIEMKNKDGIAYISIFDKNLYMDIFDKNEAKKLEYLEQLEDESLKKEGFINLMRSKKGINLKIKNLTAEEIFFKIKANL